jgi:hypothetical protein
MVAVAQSLLQVSIDQLKGGNNSHMKALGSTIAQFAAIIVIMITLAVSTAAFSMWLGDGTKSGGAGEASQRMRAGYSR